MSEGQPEITPLFTATDLEDWLQKPRGSVKPTSAAAAERVVWGWLRPLLKIDHRPEPGDVSPEVAGQALELGGIAYSNPEGLSYYQLDSERSGYSSERRNEILQGVPPGGGGPGGGVPAPQGDFPPARAYPDPAERW